MKRFFALFAALTLLCTGISAQTAACRTETGIAYRDAAGDGYVDSLCRLDICWPADKKGFPTVVWFHGGGLTGGRREIPKALCGKGFAVVGVDYRLAPRVKVADCVADAAAAAASSTQSATFTAGERRDSTPTTARPLSFNASGISRCPPVSPPPWYHTTVEKPVFPTG